MKEQEARIKERFGYVSVFVATDLSKEVLELETVLKNLVVVCGKRKLSIEILHTTKVEQDCTIFGVV